MTTYIVPCGAAKQAQPAKAADLYLGSMFAHTLQAARAMLVEGDSLYIFSAKHGLVHPEQVVAPYECKMGRKGSISAAELAEQIEFIGLEDDVYALLPQAYFAVLDEACRQFDIYPQDVYEIADGIGVQRGINRLAREACVSLEYTGTADRSAVRGF